MSTLLTRRNLLQTALLAPVTGFGATVLLVVLLNWVGPVRMVGPIATVLLLALSAWLLRRRATPVPFRRLAPFAAVVLLAALATGYPMLRFGFNWVSYANDDMANYCLTAKLFLNHGQFIPPSAQDMLVDRDASLFYWYFEVITPMRHGADELLAWALSLTGLSPQQAFMPVILAFQLVLISATGALVLQGRKYRRAALQVCFWLALSALIPLGSVYQLFGQVSGLAGLAGAAAVLIRRPGARPRSELVLGGLLLASLGTFYPEVLPFLILGYALYHALSIVQGFERVRDVVRTIWPILGWWLLFVNVSLPVTLLTLLGQSQAAIPENGPPSGLFPYYMTPAAFAYLWGFRAISEPARRVLLDISIVAGAVVFGLAVFGAAWHTWKRRPIAIVCSIMLALSFVLFRERSEFGMYKIAMYLQPFLLGVVVLTWYDLRERARRSRFIGTLLVAGLALAIGFGARGQMFYTFRSMGLGGSGLVEIPFASRDGLISQLKELPAYPNITITDSSNIVLAKFEAVYRGRLYLLSQDVFGSFLGGALGPRMQQLNPMCWIDLAGALKIKQARDQSLAAEAFDMHGALPGGNRFTVHRPVSGNEEFALLATGSEVSVLNRRGSASTHPGSIRLTSTRAEQNHLSFVTSEFGAPYYSRIRRSSGRISMYQPEDDYFFAGGTMESIGRTSLFRVLNPSPRVRLVLEYTASLNADNENRIPAGSAIGDSREMLTAVGRGSARLISPVLRPQQISGGEYVAIDMGTWGHIFPDHRSFIMGLWGREYVGDNRRIVGFCRDISLISDDQYLGMQAPRAVQSFPGDLKNKNLEYSGVYEDGWVAESSDIVLQQDDGASQLVVSVLVPVLQGRRAASWATLSVDGREVERKPVASSGIGFHISVAGKGRRRIGLHFDSAASLPSPDTRPVSAQLRYVGFQP